MSSESHNPKNDPICSNPPRNADMDGVAVAFANVVVHWCLRITITYSDGDIDLAIQFLLVQFYPILLSTLLSINRQQLSSFDVYFALRVSSSPLAIYLSLASVCDLCGFRTGLFKRIKSYRNIVRTLGAFVPLLWAALSIIEWFSDEAFLDSDCGPTLTFQGWLKDTTLALSSVGDFPSWSGPVVLFPFLVLLYRRWSQVRMDVQLSSDGAPRLRVLLIWVKCAWCTIDRRQKWCVHFMFGIVDCVWSAGVIRYAFTASRKNYVLSYGQLLSIFFILPTLVSTIEFFRSPHLIQDSQFAEYGQEAEAWYFFTGKEPDPPTRNTHLPFNVISHPGKPTISKPHDQMVIIIPSTRRPPYSPELDHTVRKWFGG